MPIFMVERYLAALDQKGVEAQAAKDEALARACSDIRHLRTTYSREDELCFSFFEAPSRQKVIAANDEAAVPFERVTEVLDASVAEAARVRHEDE